MKKYLLASAMAITALATPAHAILLGGTDWTGTGADLSLSLVVPGGNQPQNAPCVICAGNQSGQPAGFGYNDYKGTGNLDSITAFSDQGNGGRNTLQDNTFVDNATGGYTIGDGSLLKAFILANGGSNANLSFSIGIDVNDNNNPQILNSFFLLDLTTKTVLASYVCAAADCTVPTQNNGNGFPDYTLTGFNLTGVNAGHEIIFAARMSNLNDGPDSFFIEPSVAVPGPVVGAGLPGILAACVGLWGLAMKRRRRRQLAGLA